MSECPRYRILLVDDDDVDREAVIRALTPDGSRYQVTEADTARAGLAHIDEGHWDCVILDYRFPEGDAFTLFPDLFQESCADRPPVVLLTGLGDERLAASAMKGGAQDYLSKKGLSPQALREAIRNAASSAEAARAQEDQVQELRRRSMHDPLTGLPNRALFDDRLNQQIQVSSRLGERFGVMMLDLDHFKAVNDEHGHGAGDHVLKVVAERLEAAVRDSDIVARLGGDEYALILVTAKDRHGAGIVAEKLTRAIAQPIEFDGVGLDVGLSIGIAMWPEDGRARPELLHQADSAMYLAKRAGRCPPMYAQAQEAVPEHTTAIARQIPGGAGLGRLKVLYQPRVHLGTSRLHSRESLVHWQHPEFGFVPLDQAPGRQERDERMWPLARLVLEHALDSWRTWRRSGITVPVSMRFPAALLAQQEFPDLLDHRLTDPDLSPAALTIEVSESALAGQPGLLVAEMARLTATGVRIAVTEFASGWISSDYLDDVRVDQINLDRRFTEMVLWESSPPPGLQSILAFARERQIDVVADGIDSDEAWQTMANLGCTAGQGTRFSPPMRSPHGLEWCTQWQASLAPGAGTPPGTRTPDIGSTDPSRAMPPDSPQISPTQR